MTVTVAQMRETLHLDSSMSDADVVDAYVAYLEGDEPAAPLVTLDEVKAPLKVSGSDEDDLIQAYLDAAIGTIDGPDGWLGRSIQRRTLTARLDRLCADPVRLPYPPIVDVVSVEVANGSGWNVVDPAGYVFEDSRLRATTALSDVRVVYTAGYDDLPAPIRAAIYLMVGDMYRFRESAAVGVTAASAIPMSTTVASLLQPYRVYSL